jgi:hypothetical protein
MLDIQIIVVLLMTFIITLIGTLAYAIRIVGVRTGRIAITFSLFNILILVSRVATTIQTPLLTKYTEVGKQTSILSIFYLILAIGTIATMVGAICIPTFQRFFSQVVNRFSIDRSIPKIILHGFSKSGIKQFRTCVTIPKKENIKTFQFRSLPFGVITMNIFAVAMMTVGVVTPIYSGVLEPNLRATCITLSGVINGIATIILFVFVDPYLSIRTDDVIDGSMQEPEFRRIVIGMVGSKVLGAALAIPMLIPAAKLIVFIAKLV